MDFGLCKDGGWSDVPIDGVVYDLGVAFDILERGFESKKLDPGRGDELNRAPAGLDCRLEAVGGIHIGGVL